jgi:hypothetical protein
VGLGGARGCARGGGGGSARRCSLACACSRGTGHMSSGKRPCVRAQCTGKVGRGSGGVVLRCRGAATAERPRRNAGDGVPASGAAYGP